MGIPMKKNSSQMAKDSLDEIHNLLKKKKAKIFNESISSMPGEVDEIVLKALEIIAGGHAVELVRAGEEGDEITTQQAAEILNVSRPFVVKMIQEEKLSVTMVGTHRRVSRKEVLDFKEKNTKARRMTLDEMTALNQEMGLE